MENKDRLGEITLAELFNNVFPQERRDMNEDTLKTFEEECNSFYGHKIKPEYHDCEPLKHTMGGLILVGICMAIIGFVTLGKHEDEKDFTGLIIVVIGIVLLILSQFVPTHKYDILSVQDEKQAKEYEQLCNEFVAHMKKRWWESCYCDRCKVVFIPDMPRYKSVYDMKEFMSMPM